jgi:peptidoglycan hydrolase CwlO-like protein
MIGSGVGFVQGLPGKIGKKVITTVGKPIVKGIGKYVGKRFAKGGTEMAAGSLASAPVRAMAEGKDFSLEDEGTRTAVTFGLGGLGANIGARFSKGGRYIANRNKLKEAEDVLEKLTAEITQIKDKQTAINLGKQIKKTDTFENLTKQLEQTNKKIAKLRNDVIRRQNRLTNPSDYLDPFNAWITKMENLPEFSKKMLPVRKYYNERLAYHRANGMDLVELQNLKETLQDLTQEILKSTAPSKSQSIMKKAYDELRYASKMAIERYAKDVKPYNEAYGAVSEGIEATQKMADDVRVAIKPTMFQTLAGKIPHIGERPKVDTKKVATELQGRLPRYTERIEDAATVADKATGRMNRLRSSMRQSYRQNNPRPMPPQPPQLTGHPQPVPQLPPPAGSQPVPQLTGPQTPRSLPPPPGKLYGEGFETLTPEEQIYRDNAGLRWLTEQPKEPVLRFPKLSPEVEYSPPRTDAFPAVPESPTRGMVDLPHRWSPPPIKETKVDEKLLQQMIARFRRGGLRGFEG